MADVFEMTGVEAVLARLRQIGAEIIPLAGIALQQEADAILEQSKRLVPVETGSLRDSGHTEDVVIAGPVVSTGVRYGGRVGYQGRVPERYAIRIEFDVTLRHPRGGQAHFLSMATFAATQGMAHRIAEQLRNAL
jgi:hypothetical protein